MSTRSKLMISALAACSVASCKVGLRQDLESRRSHYKILLPDSTRFERLGDGTSAQLRFKTTEPVRCELFYYAQDPTQQPTKEAPEKAKCGGAEAKSDFNETILKLREDVLYNVGVYVWPADGAEAKGEALVIRERFSSGGAVRSPDGNFESILMARFNVQLGAIAVHRVQLEPPLPVSEITGKIVPQTGCGPSLAGPSWLTRSTAATVGIDALAFRGYATANATSSGNRLLASFESIQFGNPEWEWTYQTRDQGSVLVKIRTPGRLTGVELASAANGALIETDLSKGISSTQLNSQRPLIIRWQWENLPDKAFVKVRIGKPGSAGSIFCVFPAKAGQGEIDSFRVSGLQNGVQAMTVELESLSFQAFNGWLARSVDWRTINLEKS